MWERNSYLGGNLAAAGAPEFKADVHKYLDNLIYRLNQSDVRVQLNKCAVKEDILKENVDSVILATGSDPIIIPLKKADASTVSVITSNECLLNLKEIGEEIVVIGGGLVGCETALHLERMEGVKRVVIVEALDSLLRTAKHFGSNDHSLKDMLKASNIEVITSAKVREITENGISYEKEESVTEISCDTVVMAVGFRSNNYLEDDIWDEITNVRTVGDAVTPGKVLNAVHEGFHAARILK